MTIDLLIKVLTEFRDTYGGDISVAFCDTRCDKKKLFPEHFLYVDCADIYEVTPSPRPWEKELCRRMKTIKVADSYDGKTFPSPKGCIKCVCLF